MLLKISFLSLILFSSNILAEGFSFSYGFKTYNVSIQEEVIHFRSKDMALSLTNNACFKERFARFKKELDLISSGVTLKKYQEGDALKFTQKMNIYGTEENSKFGQRLLSLPRDMIKMKLIEKDLCQPKKQEEQKR